MPDRVDPRIEAAARALAIAYYRNPTSFWAQPVAEQARRVEGNIPNAIAALAAADAGDPVRQHLTAIQALVDEQAEDEGLWGIHPSGQQPITEAYLQQELRRLHAVIEESRGADA